MFDAIVEVHNANLCTVLQRSRGKGVKSRQNHHRPTELKYFGHFLSLEGIKPDPKNSRHH